MPRPRPIVDTGNIKIFAPVGYETTYFIMMPKAPEGHRKLKVTKAELFELADELGELCDNIEDSE